MMQDNTAPFRLAARAAALAIAVGATVPALAETIRCESNNGRERYCNANTSRGVQLVTQLSSRGCYQGETWGYDRRGIWVNGGCRAIFETNYYNNKNNNWNNNYYNNNDYYSGNRNNKSNDGAAVAVALAAIIGAAAIASSSSSKNKTNSSSYQSNYDRGCDYGRKDRSGGKSRDYYSHSSAYSPESEQAFAAGYNKCWNSN